ncbi:glycosyltransferase [Planococcus chinensis]|uniref:glycosyltransferase n=1 Tax=Planococcus chinensis TaxID=272917 RepID=UPI001CC38DF8|nr:glycosyltransferase [Planococcus chinensis]
MKKILFTIPNLDGGGAEKVLVTLLNNLNPKKYDITLFTIFDEGVNKNYLNKNIKHESFFKKSFKGNTILFKFLSPKQLYKLMIRKEYDIVISYLEGPTTRLVSGCPFPKTTLLNWVHIEVNNEKMIIPTYRSKEEAVLTYDRYDKTIFVSETAQLAFEETFPSVNKNFLVKYNTVDDSLIRKKSLEIVSDLDFDSKKINLISVGRFTEQKGYIRLLKIISKLVEEKFEFRLYLLGKGEEEKIYRQIIKKNNLEDYVTIVGFKENPYKYIAKCDVFICSSFREGYSTAVTESLIVGTPVITTLCSGMKEILGEENEYGIITKNTEQDLYNGLREFLTDKKMQNYYKQKASERSDYFKLKKTVKEIEELLDEPNK